MKKYHIILFNKIYLFIFNIKDTDNCSIELRIVPKMIVVELRKNVYYLLVSQTNVVYFGHVQVDWLFFFVHLAQFVESDFKFGIFRGEKCA